jgi:hypothetical protein
LIVLFPQVCDTEIVEDALQVNGCPPATFTVKVAGVVRVDIPSTVVVPARVYDTPDHVGILAAVATVPPTNPDGVDTCEDGQVVPTVRDSIGRARLLTNA